MNHLQSSKMSNENLSNYISQFQSVSRISKQFPDSSREVKQLIQKALNHYRKICSKTFASPNNNFINGMKHEFLNIFIDSFGVKESPAISKIIGIFFYFKAISLAMTDPNKVTRQNNSHENNNNNNNNNQGQGVKTKINPEKENSIKINSIFTGLSRQLIFTKNLLSLKIDNINFTIDLSKLLFEGIKKNQSLSSLILNNNTMTNECFEIIMNALLNHNKIEILNLSNNGLTDKSGNIISRLITRQSQRRDQVIWMYGLRNEKPLNNEFSKGLVSIDLSNNELSDLSAEAISYSLSSDNYIRKLSLNNNLLSENGCKKFCWLLKLNKSLVNVDLRNNQGFSDQVNFKISIRLSKNIKNLIVNDKESALEANKFIDFTEFKTEIPEFIAEKYDQLNNSILKKESSSSKKNGFSRRYSEKSNIEINNERFINNSHMYGNGNGNGNISNNNLTNSNLVDITSNKQITTTSKNTNLSKTENFKESGEIIINKKKNSSSNLQKDINNQITTESKDALHNKNYEEFLVFINSVINNYDNYSWARRNIKSIRDYLFSIELLKNENEELNYYINNYPELSAILKVAENNPNKNKDESVILNNNTNINNLNNTNNVNNISYNNISNNILPLNYMKNNNTNNTNTNNNFNNPNNKTSNSKINQSNTKYIDKGGISVISSNEEVFNPFINNQNLTHMTKFYDLNVEQIKERIYDVVDQINKIDPEVMRQLEDINSKYGIYEINEDTNSNINNININNQEEGDNREEYNNINDMEYNDDQLYQFHQDNENNDGQYNEEFDENKQIAINENDIYNEDNDDNIMINQDDNEDYM